MKKKLRRSVQTIKPIQKDKSDHRPPSETAEKPKIKASATDPIFHRKDASEMSAQRKTINSSNISKALKKTVPAASHKANEDINNEEEDPEDENEDDDDEDVEEEKPEVAKKKHEKVQSTLSSQGKDPYPDWNPGEPVPYAALCTSFSPVEMTTKRLIISACTHASLLDGFKSRKNTLE